MNFTERLSDTAREFHGRPESQHLNACRAFAIPGRIGQPRRLETNVEDGIVALFPCCLGHSQQRLAAGTFQQGFVGLDAPADQATKPGDIVTASNGTTIGCFGFWNSFPS